MTFTIFDDSLFEAGDLLTEANIGTYIGDNIMSIYHALEAPTTADNDVASTAAETTLYTVTIPANSLGSVGVALMILEGDFLYNNNTADTISLRVKWGGTTTVGSTFTAQNALSATRQSWTLSIRLANRGATNAQQLTGILGGGKVATGTTLAGVGAFGRNPSVDTLLGMMQNTAAIDTTVNQTLAVTAQWSASSANNSWRRRWAQTLIGEN